VSSSSFADDGSTRITRGSAASMIFATRGAGLATSIGT
jgi:hypothetical protein